jgi:hypothetical protein
VAVGPGSEKMVSIRPRQLAARAYGLMSSSIVDWGQKGQREAQNSQD